MRERDQKLSITRRELIRFAGASLCMLVSPAGRAAIGQGKGIIAVRVWPAEDYTRVAIEHRERLRFTHFTVKDPERLVVDLEGVEFSGILEQLSSKIAPDDPNIKLLRAGRFKPGVVRLVMELKNEVKPQVFELAPVGNYGHRLVLDVYPSVPPDPMLQLLAKHESLGGDLPAVIESKPDVTVEKQPERPVQGKPIVDRLVTITLDPGHGGEDPGAVGAGGSYEKHVTLAVAKRQGRLHRDQ